MNAMSSSALSWCSYFFFFNDTATTEIYTLSLHDALPISRADTGTGPRVFRGRRGDDALEQREMRGPRLVQSDRKSTRLNSSHSQISYAVFCLKNKYVSATNKGSIPTGSMMIRKVMNTVSA